MKVAIVLCAIIAVAICVPEAEFAKFQTHVEQQVDTLYFNLAFLKRQVSENPTYFRQWDHIATRDAKAIDDLEREILREQARSLTSAQSNFVEGALDDIEVLREELQAVQKKINILKGV